MVILGIDPGTASTGFGVVALRGSQYMALDGGVISTDSKRPLESRLSSIHHQVGAILDRHKVDALAVEDIFFGVNVRTAFAVGQARGAVLLAAGSRGVPCFTYTPQAIKKSVCGSGAAEKGQVQRMVQRLLALDDQPKTDHAADALAVAICHCNYVPLISETSRAQIKQAV